jgi:hypothetical protein
MLVNVRAIYAAAVIDSYVLKHPTVAVLGKCEHIAHLDRACWPAINSAEPDLTVFYCIIVRLRSCDRDRVAHLREITMVANSI